MLHHGRIDRVRILAFGLAAHHGQRIRFVITRDGIDIETPSGRIGWFATAATAAKFLDNCTTDGTLAAFGPREAVSAKALSSAKLRREPLDPRANPVAKAAAWLRENL